MRLRLISCCFDREHDQSDADPFPNSTVLQAEVGSAMALKKFFLKNYSLTV